MWSVPAHWKSRRIRPGVRAYHDREFPPDALTHIARIVQEEAEASSDSRWEHELVKDSKSDVYRISDGQTAYYAKHYTNPSLLEWLKALLRPPVRSAAIAERLRQDGVPVPTPAAALNIRRGWGRKERVFVSREVRGKLLRDAIADGDLGEAERVRVAEALGRIWGRLLSRGYLHMDPITGNFICRESDRRPPVVLIDLDNIYRLPPPLLRTFRPVARRRLTKFAFRLSAQLAKNGEPPIGPGEFRAFRRAYLDAGGPQRPDPKTWWRQVATVVFLRWRRRYGRPYPYRP